jgi:hypothetical protein
MNLGTIVCKSKIPSKCAAKISLERSNHVQSWHQVIKFATHASGQDSTLSINPSSESTLFFLPKLLPPENPYFPYKEAREPDFDGLLRDVYPGPTAILTDPSLN